MGRIQGIGLTGLLVGDQRKDQLLLIPDRDVETARTASVFFDGSNASGLSDPTSNVFAVTQTRAGAVFFGDGSTDSVYRLEDTNRDGDAQDADEARIWFSAQNAAGLSTVTPNGVAEGGDGAIYIANAGVSSAPQDAIYRTVDLNGDGDANDAGEASLWLDVQLIIDTAVPFDLSFDGDVAYLSDLTGTAPDALYRIEDTNGDGAIQREEVVTFISDEMSFGAPVDISNAVAPDGSVYTGTWFGTEGGFSLYRLTDLDGSGRIDDASEAVEVWNETAMVGASAAEIGFSVAADEDGRVILTANSFDGDSTVLELSDLDGDGSFLGSGETTLRADSADGTIERARAVATYEALPAPVASSVGAGNHFSTFLQDGALFSTGENVVGQLGNGATGFDVKTPRPVVLPDGFDETITSVVSGLLHTTFLTDAGDVYAFGFNNRGPLGTGDEETRTTAVRIGALDEVDIVGIENGNSTSFAIAADGTLYAWGNNSNGQLGLGDTEERLEPVIVDALAGERVAAVSADVSHTLVLSVDGDVYAFGSNVDAQVDASGERRVLDPVRVDGLPGDIVAVTAAGRTSYAVTSTGEVYGWGQSDEGQLLQGPDNGDGTFTVDAADVARPVLLTHMPAGVIDVRGGARWGVALTEDGDVYAWGPNDEGPTGGLDGDPGTTSDASFYPTKIAALDDVRIVEIETGPNSILAVADDGRVFGWGSNGDGRLGFASDGPVYGPQEVPFGEDAAPWLVSATPADNARDVETDALLTLEFTEEVRAGEGALTLVDRQTGERIEVAAADHRLVKTDGATVTITPPDQLRADTRYSVEIADDAFLDAAGQAYAGLSRGDVAAFDFSTAEVAAAGDGDPFGSLRDDVVRGGADRDVLLGLWGDDLLSGGAEDDVLFGGLGRDELRGGDGDDRLRGGFGGDSLTGGAGSDRLSGNLGADTLDGGGGDDHLAGGLGRDAFVFTGGHDTISDFDTGGGWWIFRRAAESVTIDIEGIGDLAALVEHAVQDGRDLTFALTEADSLTLEDVRLAEIHADMFLFA